MPTWQPYRGWGYDLMAKSSDLCKIGKSLNPRMQFLDCFRCGWNWKPRRENPKKCPHCGSRNWQPIKKISEASICGEENLRYKKYHYHIKTTPPIPDQVIFHRLFMALKEMLQIQDNEDTGKLESDRYILFRDGEDAFQVRLKMPSGHTKRLFKLSGKTRIHLLDVSQEGKDLLVNAVGICLDLAPANIHWEEMSDDELELLKQRRENSIHCDEL